MIYKRKRKHSKSNRQLHIQITDDIQSGLSCENDEYVKKITHTIKLTRPKTESQSDTKIYDGISYTIYQKTDKGEISLKNGSLIIPNGNEYVYENKIEASYKQAGDYCIRIYGRLGQTTKALAGHDFSIKKEPQKLTLKKSEETHLYNDLIYIYWKSEQKKTEPISKQSESTRQKAEQQPLQSV